MSYIFYNCYSLKELNLFNFNTNNVIDISYMFCNCSSLKELNLFNFNTNNAIIYLIWTQHKKMFIKLQAVPAVESLISGYNSTIFAYG